MACDVMPAHVGEVAHASDYTAGGLSSLCVAQAVRSNSPLQGLARRSGRTATAGEESLRSITSNKHDIFFELLFLVEL